jgi:hypothetical protein
MVPLLFGLASFGAATPNFGRVLSSTPVSASVVSSAHWVVAGETFLYTEELTLPDDVRALNALLALPVTTGFELDLGDE